MKRPEQWQAIEEGISTLAELTHQMGIILRDRNQEHAVHKAIKLKAPDITFIFELIAKQNEFAAMIRDDNHCDTLQQLSIDFHISRLELLGKLVEAMQALDQKAVDDLVSQLELFL